MFIFSEILKVKKIMTDTNDRVNKLGDDLKLQVRETFYKAMKDSLCTIVDVNDMSPDNVRWLTELLTEIRDRINKLTPSRRDLHIKFEQSLDTNLVSQMLQNTAFDMEDFKHIVDCIYERLKMLCAPSQDAHVNSTHQKILNLPFGPAVGTLIIETNKIIDEIESALTNINSDMLELVHAAHASRNSKK